MSRERAPAAARRATRSWTGAHGRAPRRSPPRGGRRRTAGRGLSGMWLKGQRVHPGTRGGDQRAVRQPDVPFDDDRRIEPSAARFPRRRDARHRHRLFQPRAGGRSRIPFDPGHVARALHGRQPRLDLFEQVRLGDRPGRAAHAEVRGEGGQGGQNGRYGHGCREPPQGCPARARHRRLPAESDSGPGSFRTSSGPTSGPSSPSHGMSGMAMARPRIRVRGTSPISA